MVKYTQANVKLALVFLLKLLSNDKDYECPTGVNKRPPKEK